jgi:hypothetical protein
MMILRMNTKTLIWFTWRWSVGIETCSERIKENKEKKIVGCDCRLYVYIHCMYCMSVFNSAVYYSTFPNNLSSYVADTINNIRGYANMNIEALWIRCPRQTAIFKFCDWQRLLYFACQSLIHFLSSLRTTSQFNLFRGNQENIRDTTMWLHAQEPRSTFNLIKQLH